MTEIEEARHAVYDSMVDRLHGLSYPKFLLLSKEWEIHPLRVEGKIVGALLVDGVEIHACVKPEGFKRWLTKPVLRILDNIIKEHGFALTRVTEGNTVGIEFVERLGFHFNTVWNNTIIYIKD